MSAYKEFSGKTVEEALRLAREEFGVELNDLDSAEKELETVDLIDKESADEAPIRPEQLSYCRVRWPL